MPLTAIFGGTFNPFHIGHYEILSALNRNNDIDKILILPDKIPPHKTISFIAQDKFRIKMCEIASEDFSKSQVCLTEFEREGKSYTYDTVKILKKKYPNDEFTFVCGGDMLVYFDKWYKYEELMKEISFTVFKRSDTDEKYFYDCIKKFSDMGMKITVIDDIIPSVSSTQIRKNFKTSKNLIPQKIYKFLEEKRVYIDNI